jgi:methanogenic corrinoid protein MtbC1
MVSTTSAYNLKAVLQETGLAADTLRAWERRYGLPVPNRTSGGHRLYSERDIYIIKWLIARQAEGLSISRAVDLWNEKTASGSDPLADSPLPTLTSASAASAQFAPETNLDALRAHWIKACIDFNESMAEQTLNQAFSMFPVEAVCMEVLQKGMSEIGGLWYENRASVQQEHFASALAMRRIDTLISASPAPTRQQTVIVGCAPNEWHAFTPLLISLFLRRRGLNVIYLGANVPANLFQEMAAKVHADLTVLVAQQLVTAATLLQTSQILDIKDTRVAFGGRIFNTHPLLIRHIAGNFLGETVQEAIGNIEALVTGSVKNPKAEPVSQEYATAALTFQMRRPHIEAALNQSIRSLSHTAETMKIATEFLGNNIIAALELGDMSLIDDEINWVHTLLKANRIPGGSLEEFIQHYANAVKTNVTGSGKPIHDWFSAQAEKLKTR